MFLEELWRYRNLKKDVIKLLHCNKIVCYVYDMNLHKDIIYIGLQYRIFTIFDKNIKYDQYFKVLQIATYDIPSFFSYSQQNA